MQKIHFSCTGCGQSYTVGAHVAGKKVKCPHCQTILCAPAMESDLAKVAKHRTVATEDGEPGIASHKANQSGRGSLAQPAGGKQLNRVRNIHLWIRILAVLVNASIL